MGLPVNRSGAPLVGTRTASAPIPGKVQLGDFGNRSAAPVGGTLVNGRTAAPRPTLVQKGKASGQENFVHNETGGLDPNNVSRALKQLQSNIDNATAQARANPLANGQLFQNVPLSGPLTVGLTANTPSQTGLPPGFMYLNTTLNKPLYLISGNWVDASGATAYAASNGTAQYTTVEHGFGAPAVGFIITNVANAILQGTPQIIAFGDSRDKSLVRIWTPFYYAAINGIPPTVDIYVFY